MSREFLLNRYPGETRRDRSARCLRHSRCSIWVRMAVRYRKQRLDCTSYQWAKLENLVRSPPIAAPLHGGDFARSPPPFALEVNVRYSAIPASPCAFFRADYDG